MAFPPPLGGMASNGVDSFQGGRSGPDRASQTGRTDHAGEAKQNPYIYR
jgi:hypothetical protein